MADVAMTDFGYCTVCSAALPDSAEEHSLEHTSDLTSVAIRDRLVRGLCWVCNRLRASSLKKSKREKQYQGSSEDED